MIGEMLTRLRSRREDIHLISEEDLVPVIVVERHVPELIEPLSAMAAEYPALGLVRDEGQGLYAMNREMACWVFSRINPAIRMWLDDGATKGRPQVIVLARGDAHVIPVDIIAAPLTSSNRRP